MSQPGSDNPTDQHGANKERNGTTLPEKAGAEKKWWLDNPANVKLIVMALAIICVLLFLADFFYHKHGHFDFEQWPGFYAWYGFLSYCTIVLTAKQIRKLIGRDESFYEKEDSDTNNELDNE